MANVTSDRYLIVIEKTAREPLSIFARSSRDALLPEPIVRKWKLAWPRRSECI